MLTHNYDISTGVSTEVDLELTGRQTRLDEDINLVLGGGDNSGCFTH